MTKKALKDLEHLINKDVLNSDSGLVFNGSKSDIDHLVKKDRSEIKSTICSELDKLIEASIFLKKHIPKKDGDEYSLKDVYIFGNIVELNGKLYATKLTAKHYKEGDRIGEYNLYVKEIEIATNEAIPPSASRLENKSNWFGGAVGSSHRVNIKYLLENVKDEKDKYFSEYF